MPKSTYQITKDKYRKMLMDEQLYNRTMRDFKRMFRSRHGIDPVYASFSPQADGVDVHVSSDAGSGHVELRGLEVV